jgi:hypothetical protein
MTAGASAAHPSSLDSTDRAPQPICRVGEQRVRGISVANAAAGAQLARTNP